MKKQIIYKIYSNRTNGMSMPLLQKTTTDKKEAQKIKDEIDNIMGLCAWIELDVPVSKEFINLGNMFKKYEVQS